MLGIHLPSFIPQPVWSLTMSAVDDPRMGLVIFVGAMLLCVFLLLARRRRLGQPGDPLVTKARL